MKLSSLKTAIALGALMLGSTAASASTVNLQVCGLAQRAGGGSYRLPTIRSWTWRKWKPYDEC